ncbi:hypothetical protein, partial [Stenotrophomonas sp. BR163]|uniref:hypothetical protein n=1 Tax=Stenotrophomonas sp. BR163 TaxID=3398459 RepID=UPI0039C5F133
MESKIKSKEPGNARRFAFQAFQTQSLWWIAGRLAEIVQSGGLALARTRRKYVPVGSATASMPW